ncbi:MAG: hypothetical protein JW787_16675 [Sedimentisphaerales bacterium]|nr:hypothetical protein [Sedimentisphaerales bacterium]
MNRILIKTVIVIALILSTNSVLYACDAVVIQLNTYEIIEVVGSSTENYVYLEATVVGGYVNSWGLCIVGTGGYSPADYAIVQNDPGGPGTGKYKLKIWSDVPSDGSIGITGIGSSNSDLKICYCHISEVTSPFSLYEDSKWYLSSGPIYMPLNESVVISANSDPDFGSPTYYTYFPENEPTWDITDSPSGSSPSLTESASGYCYGGSEQDMVTLSGLTVSGTYKIEVEGGTSSEDIDVIAYSNIVKIPLGSSANLSKYIIGKIYVPTKYGGTLTLTGSNNIKLFYVDGSDLNSNNVTESLLDYNIITPDSPGVYTIPGSYYGWYYVIIDDASSTEISNMFTQNGQATTRPWNGWYWPTLNSINPNNYDNGGPLDKYDQACGNTDAQATEKANHYGGSSVDGHCLGFSIASIYLEQPSTASENGVNFTQDDMEALYIELADNTGHTANYDYSVGIIPANKPTISSEQCDAYCGQVQRVLRDNLRIWHRAVSGNLRRYGSALAESNHAVWKYISVMQEAPGDDENKIMIVTSIYTNKYEPTPPADPIPSNSTDNNVLYYGYVLEYYDGEIDEESEEQNWITITGDTEGYTPESLIMTQEVNWLSEYNEEVTKENVEDIQN